MPPKVGGDDVRVRKIPLSESTPPSTVPLDPMQGDQRAHPRIAIPMRVQSHRNHGRTLAVALSGQPDAITALVFDAPWHACGFFKALIANYKHSRIKQCLERRPRDAD